MPRDPNMRVGRITSKEISDRLCDCSDARWHKEDYRLSDVYEKHGAIDIKDTLEGRGISNLLDEDDASIVDVTHAAEIIFVILDPAIVGEKVFRLMLADLAETNLEDFEGSKFNDPAPRIMVDAIRSFAFETMTAEELLTKSEDAYEGENSRADVYFYGRMAVEPSGSRVLRNFQGLVFVKMKEIKTLEQLQAIIDRMKEYDVGTVDLTNELTSRPRPRQDILP